MTGGSKRSKQEPHKKGPDSHDPAVKHEKVRGGHNQAKDIHEDRATRQRKLGKEKNS